MRRMVAAGLMVLAVAGCGGSSSGGQVAAPPSPKVTPSVSASPTHPVRHLTVMQRLHRSGLFPRHYPRVVTVSSLPFQVRSMYRAQRDRRAVAMAPGVWTALPPGARMIDAVRSDVLDGFCASVRSYERRYLHGHHAAGTCW